MIYEKLQKSLGRQIVLAMIGIVVSSNFGQANASIAPYKCDYVSIYLPDGSTESNYYKNAPIEIPVEVGGQQVRSTVVPFKKSGLTVILKIAQTTTQSGQYGDDFYLYYWVGKSELVKVDLATGIASYPPAHSGPFGTVTTDGVLAVGGTAFLPLPKSIASDQLSKEVDVGFSCHQ